MTYILSQETESIGTITLDHERRRNALSHAAPAPNTTKASAVTGSRGCHRASAPAAYASHATLPPPAQGSLPAGWLAFAGTGANSPDRDERFQSVLTSSSFPGLTLSQVGRMPSASCTSSTPSRITSAGCSSTSER